MINEIKKICGHIVSHMYGDNCKHPINKQLVQCNKEICPIFQFIVLNNLISISEFKKGTIDKARIFLKI